MRHAHSGAAANKGSISLSSAVGMGTGVMIGAGILALTGQIAQLAGSYFALSFLLGAIITSFSAYSYIKMSSAWPSSGGIAMILQKAYGPGALAAGAALLMALSMIISESLVARTFATYILRPFDITGGPLVPIFAVGVILFAFLVNVSGNKSVGLMSIVLAVAKIGGIALFGIVALWSSGFSFPDAGSSPNGYTTTGFVASVALSILAFKGFTTITNSGGEVTDPHRNVGRAIMISIAICVIVYLLVAFAVGSTLTIDRIVAAKDYSLAEAAAPAFGQTGFYFTIVIAVVATASGVLASVFAVSRMLAMLTEMKMIPHSHFGMSGSIRSHSLVYTVVLASTLAVFFDLSRIASLGAFFYLIMDMLVHWGVFRYLRHEIDANGFILLCALSFDAVILAAFTSMKLETDPRIVLYAAIAIAVVFAYERVYLSRWTAQPDSEDH